MTWRRRHGSDVHLDFEVTGIVAPRVIARRRQPLVRVLWQKEVSEPPSNVLTSETILALVGPDEPYDHTVHGL